MNVSGWIRRTLAFAVDTLVLIAAYVAFAFVAKIPFLANAIEELPMVGFWFYGSLLSLAWLYFAGFESSKRAATIGKGLFGIKVTNLSGHPLSFGLATVRYLFQAFLRFGILFIPFTKKRQALHDLIVKSVVIRVS